MKSNITKLITWILALFCAASVFGFSLSLGFGGPYTLSVAFGIMIIIFLILTGIAGFFWIKARKGDKDNEK